MEHIIIYFSPFFCKKQGSDSVERARRDMSQHRSVSSGKNPTTGNSLTFVVSAVNK